MACFNKSASHSPSLHSSMDSLELSLRHWPSFLHDLYSCKILSNQVSTCMQLMSTCQSVDINMVSMYTPGPLWLIFYWKVSRHLPIVYEDNSSGKVDFQLFFFVWVSSVECKQQISILFCLMTWHDFSSISLISHVSIRGECEPGNRELNLGQVCHLHYSSTFLTTLYIHPYRD